MFWLLRRPLPMSGLNESPSQKEGKSVSGVRLLTHHVKASMKVPPKRKGNETGCGT